MSLPRYPTYKDSGVSWLGEVPAHWEVWKLTHAFPVIGSGTTPKSDNDLYYADGDIPWVNTGDLNDGFLSGCKRNVNFFGMREHSSLRLYKAGSVVIAMYGATIGKLAIPVFDFTVNQACCVFDGSVSILPKYLFYWLMSFRSQIVSLATGGGQPNISQEILSALRIAAPAVNEQAEIAGFLDRETAKIDALIAEQEKLIALLAEKRQATISRAVTRGLNPNVPLKDSGVPWLGNVPAHWSQKQLKHVAKPGTSITYGIVQAGPHFEGGIPYIKTSDMSGDSLPLDGYALTSPEIDSAYSRSKVFCGDIVIAIRATVGKCLPVPPELSGANLTQGTAKISPSEDLDSSFLLWALRSLSVQAYFDQMAKGATFKEITLDALRRTPVLVPPKREQESIAEFVECVDIKFGKLSSDARQSVQLLKERRAALIAAAVTGKIDVRGLAA